MFLSPRPCVRVLLIFVERNISVTCFLPVAFINYYPSVVLLGKAAPEVQLWQYGAPVVAVILLAIAAFIWSKGVKRYAGTGN